MTETAAEPTTISSYVNKELYSFEFSKKDHTSDLQRLANLLKTPQDSRIVSNEEVTELETLEKDAAAELTFREKGSKADLSCVKFLTSVTIYTILFLIAFQWFLTYKHLPVLLQIFWSAPCEIIKIVVTIWYMSKMYPMRQFSSLEGESKTTMTSEELNRRQTDLLKVFEAINETNKEARRNSKVTEPLVILHLFILAVYFFVRIDDSLDKCEKSLLEMINGPLFLILLSLTISFLFFFAAFSILPEPSINKTRHFKKEQKERSMSKKKRICKKCKKTVKKVIDLNL